MELSKGDVLWILKLLETTDVEYLEVQLEGMKLTASRSGRVPTEDARPAAVSPAATPASPRADARQYPAVEVPAGLDPGVEALEGQDGLVTVVAPMVGVFYVAPEPGAPPYVEVGSYVKEGTTIGLIEVMKMFNSVSAVVTGEVARCLVGNGEFVEFGQPLFLIRTDTSA